MFVVVEFTETQEVGIVPKNWIQQREHETITLWPNYRSSDRIQNSIRKQEDPNLENFKSYRIRILKHYESYGLAQKNLPKFEYQSDVTSEAETILRKGRKQPVSLPHYSTSDEEEVPPAKTPRLVSVDHLNSSPPKLPQYPVPCKEVEIASSNHVTPHNLVPNPPTPIRSRPVKPSVRNLGLSSLPSSSNTNESESTLCNTEFEKWMVRNVTILKAQIRQLQEAVDALSNDCAVKRMPEQNENDEKLPFPPRLSSINSYDSFCESLANEKLKTTVVEKLGLRGGKQLGDCVRRIMSSLFDDNLASSFSWLGSRGGKTSFALSALRSVVYEAVRKNKKHAHAQDSDIDDIVKEWLKNANKRLQNKKTSQSKPDESAVLLHEDM